MFTSFFPCARLSRFSQAAFVSAGLVLGSVLAGAATTPVFSDDFSDGNRDGWYNLSGNNTGLVVSSNTSESALTGNALKGINSGATGVVYFSETTLGVGESLTVSFDMSFASIAVIDGTTVTQSLTDGSLRLVVLGSAGNTKVSADSTNPSQFGGYEGYRIFTNTSSTNSGRTNIARKDSANTSLTGSSPWTTLTATGSTAGVGLSAVTAYSGFITFERTGSSTLVTTFSMNGVVASATDSSATNFSFDTFGYSKASTNGTIFIDNVLVSYSSIPEPSSAVLLSGLAVGMMAISGRRARRRSV